VTSRRPLLIVGAGGHGRVIADTAESLGYTDIAFCDDAFPDRQSNLTWPIIAKSVFSSNPIDNVFVAMGRNETRLSIIKRLIEMNVKLPSLVHPTAHVSRQAAVGIASFVGPQAAVNVGSVLGIGVIVNTAASVDHDCQIGDGVHISPGARLAGSVSVGRETWIGIGAAVRENISIGERVTVGAGACVVADVENNMRVLGVPARRS
jgi:sugar O-acyltransferase (sialic acid O-acetyltransferase NeuD family)